MGDISRDSDVVELNGPPAFNYGDKVRSYGVEYIATGYRVGMKRKELEYVESYASGEAQ